MTTEQHENAERSGSRRGARRLRTPVGTALVVSFAVLAAACGSSEDSSDAAGSVDAGPVVTVGSDVGGQVDGVRAPDAFTALTLTPVNSGTFPVLGTDGKYHVAYDLLLTNASKVPGSIEKLEVVDGADPTKVIASFTGTQLVSDSSDEGDANRLRTLPAGLATSADIAPQESRALFVDISVDSLDDLPRWCCTISTARARPRHRPRPRRRSTTSPHRSTSPPGHLG